MKSDTFLVKIINNQKLDDTAVLEEIINAEGRMNMDSKLRFHATVNWMERVEETFKGRCIKQQVKWGSKKYYEVQAEFFSGAMSVVEECPPYWTICVMSHREIIPQYKLTL